MEWVTGRMHCKVQSQIAAEIDYFMDYYETLHPVVFLSYEREAHCCKNGGSFAIDSADDAVHSNANVTINGGNVLIDVTAEYPVVLLIISSPDIVRGETYIITAGTVFGQMQASQ